MSGTISTTWPSPSAPVTKPRDAGRRREVVIARDAVEQLDAVARRIAQVRHRVHRARLELLGAGAAHRDALRLELRDRGRELGRAAQLEAEVAQARAVARVQRHAPLPVVHLEVHRAVGRHARAAARAPGFGSPGMPQVSPGSTRAGISPKTRVAKSSHAFGSEP